MAGITASEVQSNATSIASTAVDEINKVIKDIASDGWVNNDVVAGVANQGLTVAQGYEGTTLGNTSIATAAGAMVIDDLMQKISTKVQVAAQILAASNNLTKTVARTVGQG
jgi:hypothetical protein